MRGGSAREREIERKRTSERERERELNEGKGTRSLADTMVVDGIVRNDGWLAPIIHPSL